MSYTLFDEKKNFTRVLFGKSDAELVKERGISIAETSSENLEEAAHVRNIFLQKVLDALLEVDPYAVRLPTHSSPHPIAPPRNSPSPALKATSISPPCPSQRQMTSTNLPSLMTIAPRRSPSPPSLMTIAPRRSPSPPPLMSIAVSPPFLSQKHMIPPMLPQYQLQYCCRPVPLMAIPIPPPHFCY